MNGEEEHHLNQILLVDKVAHKDNFQETGWKKLNLAYTAKNSNHLGQKWSKFAHLGPKLVKMDHFKVWKVKSWPDDTREAKIWSAQGQKSQDEAENSQSKQRTNQVQDSGKEMIVK